MFGSLPEPPSLDSCGWVQIIANLCPHSISRVYIDLAVPLYSMANCRRDTRAIHIKREKYVHEYFARAVMQEMMK